MFFFGTANLAFASVGDAAASDWDVLAAVWSAGPVVKGVMLILLGFSVFSWAIIIAKFRQLRRARKEDGVFLDLFWKSPDLTAAWEDAGRFKSSPAAALFRQGFAAVFPRNPSPDDRSGKEKGNPAAGGEHAVRRAVRGALAAQVQLMTQSLCFLATCGNTAPFIGLFGTVWGIMTSFHSIAYKKGVASIAAVAPGISEALVATAAGLAVAIPAVIAYNYFTQKIRIIEAELDSFSADLLNIIERDLILSREASK